MNEQPETVLPRRRRVWLRRLAWLSLCLLLLLTVAGIVAWRWLQSASFNRFVAGQIEEGAKDYGLNVKVGGFGWSWSAQDAKLKDLRVTNAQGQLIADIQEANLDVEILRPYSRREVVLRHVTLNGVTLHVNIDEQGKTNFEGLRQPPKKDSFIKFDSSQLAIALANSTVNVNDARTHLTTALQGVTADIQLKQDAPISAVLKQAHGKMGYGSRDFTIDALQATTRVDAKGLQVEKLHAQTQLGEFTTHGKLADWQAWRYDFAVTVTSELAEVMRVFAPAIDLRGRLESRGQLTGERTKLVYQGTSNSSDLTFAQTRVRNLVAGAAQIKVQGQDVSFTTDRVRVANVVSYGVKLDDLAASGVQGTYKQGRLIVNANTAQAGHVVWQGGVSREASVRNVTYTLAGQHYTASGEAAIAGAEVELGGKYGKLAVGHSSAPFKLDNESVNLASFKTSLLEGTAEGTAEIAFARAGQSHVKTRFNHLPTNQLLALAAFKREQLPITGKVNGDAEVSFANNDLLRLRGAINVQFDGQGTEGVSGIPLNGVVALEAANGVFTVNSAQFKTDVTTVTASGNVSVDGDSALQLQLVSTDASQFLTIANSCEPAQPYLQQYEPLLTGELTFNGKMTGKLEAPVVEGELDAASVGAKDALLGALTGQLSVSRETLRFTQGHLAASNGGSVKFELATPLQKDAASNGALTATIDRLELEAVLGAVGSPAALDFITGNVSGTVNLSGLPNEMRGGGKLALLDGKIVKQAADLAEVEFKLDGRNVTLDRLEARLLQSSLTARGALNLDDKQFNVEGNAQQIALARLAETFEFTTATVAGTADATFNVSGAFDNVDNLRVELSAQGQNVNVNGRDTGKLKLIARTDAGGKIDAELVTGILATAGGKPERIRGQIELRKEGRPVVIESDLADLDLTTVLATFASDLTETFKGKLNGKLRLAGPTVNAQGEATLEQLRGQVSFDAVELAVRGNDLAVTTPLVVELNGTQIKLPQTKVTGQGIELNLGGAYAWQGETPMDFAVNGLIRLANLPPLLEDTRLDGTVVINNGRITGTADKPVLNGEVLLRDIGVTSPDAPAPIERGRGRLMFNGDRGVLESFTANVNDGTLEIKGEAGFEGLRASEWRADVSANNVDILYDEVRATVNGKLALNGTAQGQTLSGTLTVPSAEYTGTIDLDGITTGRVISTNLGRFRGPGLGKRDPGFPPINLNVRVEARDSLLIRDDEINTVASAVLTLSGPLTDPTLIGRVSAEGGAVRFRGQRYEVTTATLDFFGDTNPAQLNLLAEGNTSGYRINIGFVGPLDQIELTLRAEPNLTRDEILSLITTGRTESRTTGGADPRLSTVDTVSSLLTTQLTKPAERALGLIGINRFQIDPVFRPNTNPAARATIGAQLARNVYFTFAANLAAEQDSTVLLEYTFSNSFSVIGSFTQGGSGAGSGLARNNDFVIEIRGRKRFDFGKKDTHLATTTPEPETQPKPDNVPKGIRFNWPEADVQVKSSSKDIQFSTRQLRELLPVKTQGFSRSLARLGERRLKNYLQEKGYFFAEVGSRCEPVNCQGDNLKVFYDVEGGERYQLTDVRFEGLQSLAPVEVAPRLQSQPANVLGGVPFLRDFVGGLKRGLTSNERVRADAELLRRTLIDRGYRDARVRSRFAVTEDQGLVVVFSVEEGIRTSIADVVVRGNALLTADELREVVPIKASEAFSYTNAVAGAQQIEQLYRQRGYLEANAEVEFVELAPDRVRLLYHINEGQQARLEGDVQVLGADKTKPNWLRRYYDFRPGALITPAQLLQTQRDLYATGAFREVGVTTKMLNPDTGAHQVTINLTEAKPLLLVYGLGYSTDDGRSSTLSGLRGLTQLSWNNIGGTLDSATLRLRASRREQFSQFSFTDLRPFGTKWPTTFSAFYTRNNDLQPFTRRREFNDGKIVNVNDTSSFGLQRFAAFIQSERKFNDSTSVRFRYNLERANLFNFEQNFPETEITRNERAVRLGIFSAGVTRDTRDNLLNPTRGQLISADSLLAAKALGGNESFNKFFANYQRYYSFDPATRALKDATLAFSARLGLARVFQPADRNRDGIISESERRLPISERFFSGGATTLRGFKFETAGPQGVLAPRPIVQKPGEPLRYELPALIPLGGDALAVLNFELRYPLTSRMRLVPFYDLGNVFYKVSDLNWKNLTNTLGLGIRFNTPLGPIGVDYGFLLDPPAFQFGQATLRQPRGAFHVRFGQTF
jgi:outer membrane protein insertion porin family